MSYDIELLSPVGDFECLKAAVQNGANSVYFGGSLFNARASATNFNIDELEKVINYCALRNVKTHLTLNTLIKDSEFKDAVMLAKKAYELGIDALIVQDIGLAQFLRKLFPDLAIHASTQMTIHNLEGVQKLEQLGYTRAVLSRELTLSEIEYICSNSNIEIETFIHGALCISYSGQCLFSSMVGGRSGNRGRCAQPCRLPYELIEDHLSNKKHISHVIDKGYIISPKDLCSLDYIPSLIEAGVKCFKIEGRLKSPEYVATVTRIYRKYIDMFINKKEYIVDEKDIHDLKQIFNRGGFSSGHLDSHPNRELICKEKPNNMGIYIGNVANYNKLNGHIKILLNEKLSLGDTINFEKENTRYTVSELMLNNNNEQTVDKNNKVTIGRMKGNIHAGDKVFKLSSKEQLEKAKLSYNSENIKIPLGCNLLAKKGSNITASVYINNRMKNSLYNNITINYTSNIIPEEAKSSPTTKERIISQLSKTTNTPFYFEKFNIDMDDNIFIPSIKELNEIRRVILSQIENTIINRIKRNNSIDEKKIDNLLINEYSNSNIHYNLSKYNSQKNISVYLNVINTEFDYSSLSKEYINNIYIPLRHFMNKNYTDTIKQITSNFKTYIYIPAIVKTNYKNIVKHSLDSLIEQYKNISGFVLSSLGDFILLQKYINNFEFIGNFSFNVFNRITINSLLNLGLSKVTLSPELNINDLNTIVKSNLPLELIVYGNTPVMKMNYCVLGNSNRCYPDCKMKCTTSNTYFLKDRLGFYFKIIPDNIQTVTTIFNSKTTCITDIDININNFRIDCIDETIDEINNIAKATFFGNKLEGKQYTRGNLYRDV